VTAFRVLVAVVLLLNGLAMPPASALHAGAGSASHAGHTPDSASAGLAGDASHCHHSADMESSDCCEISTCDCGCAAPQAATLPLRVLRTSWQPALPIFSFKVKSCHSSPLPAPFRPPA
jgi:hypothetical protein